MNISDFPVSGAFQMNEPLAVVPGQQDVKPTNDTSGFNAVADTADHHLPSEASGADQEEGERLARIKRGWKFPGFSRPRPRPSLPNNVPSHGVPGTYIPKPTPPRLPVAPSYSPGMNKFRDVVLKTQTTGSSLSGPARPVAAQPKTFGDVATNLIAADRLVKAGVFKTNASLKTVARDAFVNASVNGLVSTPLSIGAYAGSVWTGETIKGNFSANTPLLPPAHQPPLNQQAINTKQQDAKTITLRLENAELKMLYAVNTIQTLIEGGSAQALEKHKDWPVDIKGRLEKLDALYAAAEQTLESFARDNDFIFRPHKAVSNLQPGSEASRLDELDKRNESINNGIARIVAIRELEVGKKAPVV